MRASATILCAALGALLAGCNLDAPPNAKGESIFEFFAPPTPQEAVAWAIDPYDADKRYRGLLLIANSPFGGERPYVQMYERAAEDGDPGVRAMAIRALAMHGSPEHASIAIGRLTESDELVRWESARALQRMHDSRAVSPLLSRLSPAQEESTKVRAEAAAALGQYAEPRVVQALIQAVGDRQLAVNYRARDALVILTGEDFDFDQRRWLAWTTGTRDVFANRGTYVYPVFERDKRLLEHLMFWTVVPNEIAAEPIGMPARETPVPGGA